MNLKNIKREGYKYTVTHVVIEECESKRGKRRGVCGCTRHILVKKSETMIFEQLTGCMQKRKAPI